MYLVEKITDRISILGLINVPEGTGDLTTFINPLLGDKIATRVDNSLNRCCKYEKTIKLKIVGKQNQKKSKTHYL